MDDTPHSDKPGFSSRISYGQQQELVGPRRWQTFNSDGACSGTGTPTGYIAVPARAGTAAL